MATRIDKEACREAYNLVRDDNTEINWAAFKYEGHMIVPAGQGTDYEEFKSQCTGENVSGLQRAKISTDKTLVKDIVQNFAKEFMISDARELEEDYIRTELKKAGGANYDAQGE
ncbi:unnamed protein product [Coregonus sp. 'balchen']|nr:unnamed protein product [Coregonus sp. 'balchen']